MLRLDHAYQKSITHSLTMQKIFVLVCQRIICWNIVNNYSMTSGRLWNYYRHKINNEENKVDNNNNNNNNNNRINNNKTIRSKSFEYKTKIIGSMPNNNNILDAEVVPLKYLSKFWRSLDLRLINCEIELDLRWSNKWVISEISRTFRAVGNPPVQDVAAKTTGTLFQISNTKLYVSFVTLSINYNIKFLENIKQGFK